MIRNEDLKWLISLVVGIFAGVFVTYTTLKVDDAVLREKIATIEYSVKQNQVDINIFRVDIGKIKTDITNREVSDKALRETLKEVANSNRAISIALTRLDERQGNLEKILEQLSNKLDLKLKEKNGNY